jgi:hypothetical protein
MCVALIGVGLSVTQAVFGLSNDSRQYRASDASIGLQNGSTVGLLIGLSPQTPPPPAFHYWVALYEGSKVDQTDQRELARSLANKLINKLMNQFGAGSIRAEASGTLLEDTLEKYRNRRDTDIVSLVETLNTETNLLEVKLTTVSAFSIHKRIEPRPGTCKLAPPIQRAMTKCREDVMNDMVRILIAHHMDSHKK